MWFDAMGEGMMGMYYITFSNHDDAVNWIKADIEHYKKLADNRTIEHIPFFTRSERIQKLNK